MAKPNKENLRLFYVIQNDDLTEEEILEEVKKAHSKGADINPIDRNTELTILQTALDQGFLTIVKYLEYKISESEASVSIIVQVNKTSSDVIESPRNNESEASTSGNICKVNENTLNKKNPNATQNVSNNKVNENKDSTSAGQNPVPNVSENKASHQNKDTTNPAATNPGQNPVRKSVNVPGDGSCLFWAITLALLFPARSNLAEFERRFKKLFDLDCPGKR